MSLGPIGRFFAKDSIKSQEFLTAKFEEYYRIGIFLDPSDLTRQRFDWHMSRGFSERDLAKLEVGHGIAILSNTAPAAFWFTLHIFSDPKVLQACREEVLQHVVDSKGSTGNPVRSFDIMALRTSCPILQSAFKEAMRLHSVSVGLRMVLQDHLLDGKYLLKKDAIVFMPSTVQHFDYERWGADAAEYKHDRFVDRTRPRVNNISFRAFGGGTTLCPGRHFAMTEILTLASMLLLRFELKPESGTWVIPTTKKAGLASIMPSPDFDVDVKMTRRADDEGVEWVWKLSDSEHKVCPEEKEMDEKSSEEKL
jgi:cytochrome P450